jgi:hypothetical protein
MTVNPSYSGGRDQEDCGSKPAQANSSQDPISKNPSQKRAGGVAQGAGPEFKPQDHPQKELLQKLLGLIWEAALFSGGSEIDELQTD